MSAKAESAPPTQGRFVTNTSRLMDDKGARIPRGRIVIATTQQVAKLLKDAKLRPATARDIEVERQAFRKPSRLRQPSA